MKRCKGYLIITGLSLFTLFGVAGGLTLNRMTNGEALIITAVCIVVGIASYSRATVLYNRERRKAAQTRKRGRL